MWWAHLVQFMREPSGFVKEVPHGQTDELVQNKFKTYPLIKVWAKWWVSRGLPPTWYNNHKSIPLQDESTLSGLMAKTKCTPKDPGWIKQYQLTVNEIINSLGGDAKVSEKFGLQEELKTKVATRKSGPTISSFLEKIQQQWGWRLLGLLLTGMKMASSAHLTSALRIPGNPPSPKFIQGMLNNSSENGETGFPRMDEDPEELPKKDWVQLLNEDDGVYSLKPWDEVVQMKANKTKIALACREIMRQAWEATKIRNPTRMGLKDLEVYWKHWALEEGKGRPFAFHTDKGKGREREKIMMMMMMMMMREEVGEKRGMTVTERMDRWMKKMKKMKKGLLQHPLLLVQPLPSTRASHSPANDYWSSKTGTGTREYWKDLLFPSSESRCIGGCGFSKWVLEFQVAICQMVMGYCPPFQVHRNCISLQKFLQWLNQKTLDLPKQASLSKNRLQDLLLGVGLLLRDLHFACIVDYDEIEVPGYVTESCMDAGDVGSITRVLENISNVLQDELSSRDIRRGTRVRKPTEKLKSAENKSLAKKSAKASKNDTERRRNINVVQFMTYGAPIPLYNPWGIGNYFPHGNGKWHGACQTHDVSHGS
ncbi:hypothetical protein BJ322DRAFT_1022917 [Thelephora terrestris]|uniref:Uncharacterized protein n=1 Tax=Thelephora terrestris TaxID=56493 RepID=A0A9P6L445_9AGAM|nr:hypothetical protein BJ322DRAFT_1022917 [Thelephora terrestris]